MNQRGNMLFYILIAIVLFAAISFMIARMTGGVGDAGGAERAKLSAQTLLEYAQKAKVVVQDMKIGGVTTDNLSFLQTGDTGYTTAPHTNKVFHPEGGGLPIQNLATVLTDAGARRMEIARAIVPGIGTTASDVVVGFRGLPKLTCEALNRLLVGDSTVTNETTEFDDIFDTLPNGDMTTCNSCDTQKALCFLSAPDGAYIFYSVIDAN